MVDANHDIQLLHQIIFAESKRFDSNLCIDISLNFLNHCPELIKSFPLIKVWSHDFKLKRKKLNEEQNVFVTISNH